MECRPGRMAKMAGAFFRPVAQYARTVIMRRCHTFYTLPYSSNLQDESYEMHLRGLQQQYEQLRAQLEERQAKSDQAARKTRKAQVCVLCGRVAAWPLAPHPGPLHLQSCPFACSPQLVSWPWSLQSTPVNLARMPPQELERQIEEMRSTYTKKIRELEVKLKVRRTGLLVRTCVAGAAVKHGGLGGPAKLWGIAKEGQGSKGVGVETGR